ncbi:ribosome biogenesis regulatory protein homolog [Xenia sp. Carnegie-2017]|uniref:ribosome biogenesis regulatory protein homolog n=1 Tax=Xenia sp. Carnegie-2017 TaxID=2897299 RepID=UPI001F0347CE|nr:ribosome biogenesis regulatory protein homolog [Xenia sp. Carnegie-2017]
MDAIHISHETSIVNIEDIISAAEVKDEQKFKSTEVNKLIEPQFDVRNLLLTDINIVEKSSFKNKKDEILRDNARDNTQFLLNCIWKLPVEKCDNVVLVQLPEATTVLPREKQIPKPKPLTKWQEFAKKKGYRKRGRMLYDTTTKSWQPRWGFKRAKDDTKEWLIEVPANANPYEDQFLKREKDKKERVAKNKYQCLRNMSRSQKFNKSTSDLTPAEKPSRSQIKASINAARLSTASLGKFTPSLKNEKSPKTSGTKRKEL